MKKQKLSKEAKELLVRIVLNCCPVIKSTFPDATDNDLFKSIERLIENGMLRIEMDKATERFRVIPLLPVFRNDEVILSRKVRAEDLTEELKAKVMRGEPILS